MLNTKRVLYHKVEAEPKFCILKAIVQLTFCDFCPVVHTLIIVRRKRSSFVIPIRLLPTGHGQSEDFHEHALEDCGGAEQSAVHFADSSGYEVNCI